MSQVDDAVADNRHLQAENEQLVAQLRLVNAIQRGIAEGLGFEAVVELAGDGLSQVFHGADVGIIWHDSDTNLLHFLYELELGERVTVTPQTPSSGGAFEQIAESRRPKVVNSLVALAMVIAVLGVAASLYPARRASRLNVIAAVSSV